MSTKRLRHCSHLIARLIARAEYYRGQLMHVFQQVSLIVRMQCIQIIFMTGYSL